MLNGLLCNGNKECSWFCNDWFSYVAFVEANIKHKTLSLADIWQKDNIGMNTRNVDYLLFTEINGSIDYIGCMTSSKPTVLHNGHYFEDTIKSKMYPDILNSL